MRVSSEEESTDLPSIAKRPHTNKPTGRRSVFFNIFLKIRILKFASSQILPELRAGIAWKREETESNIHTNLVVPKRRITTFSMRRANLICSILTQSWCRTFILFGSKNPTKNETAHGTVKCLQKHVMLNEKPCIFIQIVLWNLSTLVKTYVGIKASQKSVLLLFRFSQVFQKSGGEKQCNASVICDHLMVQ